MVYSDKAYKKFKRYRGGRGRYAGNKSSKYKRYKAKRLFKKYRRVKKLASAKYYNFEHAKVAPITATIVFINPFVKTTYKDEGGGVLKKTKHLFNDFGKGQKVYKRGSGLGRGGGATTTTTTTLGQQGERTSQNSENSSYELSSQGGSAQEEQQTSLLRAKKRYKKKKRFFRTPINKSGIEELYVQINSLVVGSKPVTIFKDKTMFVYSANSKSSIIYTRFEIYLTFRNPMPLENLLGLYLVFLKSNTKQEEALERVTPEDLNDKRIITYERLNVSRDSLSGEYLVKNVVSNSNALTIVCNNFPIDISNNIDMQCCIMPVVKGKMQVDKVEVEMNGMSKVMLKFKIDKD